MHALVVRLQHYVLTCTDSPGQKTKPLSITSSGGQVEVCLQCVAFLGCLFVSVQAASWHWAPMSWQGETVQEISGTVQELNINYSVKRGTSPIGLVHFVHICYYKCQEGLSIMYIFSMTGTHLCWHYAWWDMYSWWSENTWVWFDQGSAKVQLPNPNPIKVNRSWMLNINGNFLG